MNARPAFLFLIPGAIASSACGERVGSLSRGDSQLVLQHGSAPFDAAAWRHGRAEARGEMLASLFRDELPKPRRNAEVYAVLGPSDCYVGYEDEPCYIVQLGRQRYNLEFPVNHGDREGRIIAVRLRPGVAAAGEVRPPAP